MANSNPEMRWYHPGHATTWTKGNKRRGTKPKPILPTPYETAILRRVAMGFLIVTFHGENEPTYTYEDGTSPVMVTKKQIDRMVKNNWLIPDKTTTLFKDNGETQVYRARKP